MPQYDYSFINANLTMEYLDKIAKDVASNQEVDDDIQMHRYEMMERFGTPEEVINTVKEEIDILIHNSSC